jgi:hypothetical protein
MYLKRQNIDERDQEVPRVWRAAIYLCEPGAKNAGGRNSEPPIVRQRMLCRRAAAWLRVEVVGEFVDTQPYVSLRPGLHQALELAQKRRLDYLIVSSLDRLASNEDEAFEVAWCLGHAGTVPVPAYKDD